MAKHDTPGRRIKQSDHESRLAEKSGTGDVQVCILDLEKRNRPIPSIIPNCRHGWCGTGGPEEWFDPRPGMTVALFCGIDSGVYSFCSISVEQDGFHPGPGVPDCARVVHMEMINLFS